jgi:uncharacterized damage-inducible protein DinB
LPDMDNSSTEVSRAFLQGARAFLKDEYLPKIERCLAKLSDEHVWWRPNAESNSIGNLLLHLEGNARQWIISGLGRETDRRVRHEEFDERKIIPRVQLQARLKQTVEEVDAVLASLDRDRLLARYQIQGTEVTGLKAIFHVTEHFSMHTGQIILLAKIITATDLQFYDFVGDTPVHRWRS